LAMRKSSFWSAEAVAGGMEAVEGGDITIALHHKKTSVKMMDTCRTRVRDWQPSSY
jgi:hypothetical protein